MYCRRKGSGALAPLVLASVALLSLPGSGTGEETKGLDPEGSRKAVLRLAQDDLLRILKESDLEDLRFAAYRRLVMTGNADTLKAIEGLRKEVDGRAGSDLKEAERLLRRKLELKSTPSSVVEKKLKECTFSWDFVLLVRVLVEEDSVGGEAALRRCLHENLEREMKSTRQFDERSTMAEGLAELAIKRWSEEEGMGAAAIASRAMRGRVEGDRLQRYVSACVLFSLAEEGSSAQVFAPLLKSKVLEVRLLAVRAVSRSSAEDAVRVLAGALTDKEASVRIQAAVGLKRMGGVSASSFLLKQLRVEEDETAKRVIRSALRRLRTYVPAELQGPGEEE